MLPSANAPPTLDPELARARKPRALVLNLLGLLTHEQPIALSTGTFLDALGRLGVSSHAARSTLSRLVDERLLCRHRRGRQTYYTLTLEGSDFLHRGNTLVWQKADSSWDGVWTLAVGHWIEHQTGWSIKKFVRTARRYRTVQIKAGRQILTAVDPLPDDLREALAKITSRHVH